MPIKLSYVAALGLAFISSAASAHTGVGETHGYLHGFLHPLVGVDHVLAMVAVGLFAAHIGGRALWLVPASFIGIMVMAGSLGAARIPIPFIETGIAFSVIAFGLVIAFGARPPVAIAMTLVAFFAVFHGYAHGAELPEEAPGIAYGAGFLLATALLHAVAIGVGLLLGRGGPAGEGTVRLCGCVISLAGAAILVGMI